MSAKPHRVSDFAAAAIDFGVFGATPIGLVVQLSRGPALLLVPAGVQVAVLRCTSGGDYG